MKAKEIRRSLVFLLLAAALLLACWVVFDRKNTCDYTARIYGFFNEPEDSMDVLFYGSSHAYCTVSPLELWHETGLQSYVLATQSQPPAATLHYIKQSLEHQSPQLLVVEAFMFILPPEERLEASLRDCIDALPWRENKVELIQRLVAPGERSSYYFNFLKYHSRWKELSGRDMDFSYLNGTDNLRGYIYLTPRREAECYPLDYTHVQPQPLPEENAVFLDELLALARDSNKELALFIAPMSGAEAYAGQFKTLHEYAEANGIPVLDFNEKFAELGFDCTEDFFDFDHLNATGASKATAALARWMEQNFQLIPNPNSDEDSWQADYTALYGE